MTIAVLVSLRPKKFQGCPYHSSMGFRISEKVKEMYCVMKYGFQCIQASSGSFCEDIQRKPNNIAEKSKFFRVQRILGCYAMCHGYRLKPATLNPWPRDDALSPEPGSMNPELQARKPKTP